MSEETINQVKVNINPLTHKPIKVDYPNMAIEDVITPDFKQELDKITFDKTTSSNTSRTIRNIRKNITAKIKSEFNITDKNELREKVDAILKIQGLHEDNFDFMSNFDNGLQQKINDISIDDNANKSEKSVNAFIFDLTKPVHKLIGHDTLYRVMKDLYGRTEAKRLSASMYDYSLGISDSTGINSIYCWALDTTKLVTIGRNFGSLHSKPSKRVSSYISAVCETVHQISNHIVGAAALATFFLDIAHLMIYKQRITLSDLRNNIKGVRKNLENEFQQFIYSVNHNSRDGASQTPFTNVSLFDKVKLATLIGDENYSWYFPNKKAVASDLDLYDKMSDEDFRNYVIDYITECQNVFLDLFDKGDPLSNGAPYTFPVNTINLSKDENGNALDQSFLKSICKRDIAKYNIFCSSGTKIASCCLSGDEIIQVYEYKNNLWQTNAIKLSEFVNSYITKDTGPDFEMDISSDLKSIDAFDSSDRFYTSHLDRIIKVLRKPNETGEIIEFLAEFGLSQKVTPNHLLIVKDKHQNKIIKDIPAFKVKEDISRYQLPTLTLEKKIFWEDILEAKTYPHSGFVYCLETEFHHNFAANGIITHNCRMINSKEMMDSFASQVNSLGGGGSASIGSHRVVTINFQRIALECSSLEDYYKILDRRIEDAAKILKAHKLLILKIKDAGLQPFITNGYINVNRLFSTFGILGTAEANKTLRERFDIPQDEDLVKEILVHFNQKTLEEGAKLKLTVNQEQIPAESMATRFASADKVLFNLPDTYYKLYANQHIPLWEDKTVFERVKLAGSYDKLLTGGSIVHLNVDGDTTPQQNMKLIEYAIKCDCEHFAINKCYTICNDCGYTTNHKTDTCEKCSSKNVDHKTRIIGYFSKVSNWGKVRREWEFPRRVFKSSTQLLEEKSK